MSALPKLTPQDDAGPARPVRETVQPEIQPSDKVLVTERPDEAPALPQLLQVAAQKFGKSPVQLLTEFARLAMGPGRLTIDEYFAYGLYDDKTLAGRDKSHFAGLRAMREAWMAINWDETWDGIFSDKLALEVLFRGLGLPTTSTLAIFTDSRTIPSFPVLADTAGLAAFLRNPAIYPLFGKPTDSTQSLGSSSFESYDASTDELVGTQDGRVAVSTFAQEVASSFRNGYLFQRRLSPHASIRALVGERLATVRVMTVLTRNGPEILRVVWKIPGGVNVADNFWRPGNMLGQLDIDTGRIIRVVGGTGMQEREFKTHPDTGADLIGAAVPDWDEVKKLALTGAGIFHKTPLIGWDIAPTDDGPLIVEPNNSPDFGLPQIADRRGMLDERMKALMAERLAEKKAATERLKVQFKTELRNQRRRISRSSWN